MILLIYVTVISEILAWAEGKRRLNPQGPEQILKHCIYFTIYFTVYEHLYKKSLKYRKILITSQGKEAFLLIPDGVTVSLQRHKTSSSGRIIPALLCCLCFLITQSVDTFSNVRASS